MPDYLVDEVVIAADDGVLVDLPVHADVVLDGSAASLVPGMLDGGRGLEDGFRFLRDAACQPIDAGVLAHGVARQGTKTLRLWACSDTQTSWWRVRAPGPPGAGDQNFRVLRTRGRQVRHRFVLAWSPGVTASEIGATISVTMTDGTVHTHQRTDAGWRLDVLEAGTTSTIVFAGRRPTHPSGHPELSEGSAVPPVPPIALERGDGRTFELGERHYRRSEQSWREAGKPTAIVEVRQTTTGIRLAIVVPRSDRTFAPATAVNRYDNEHPDINGDGVQLHVRTAAGLAGWTLIPERDSERVRVRAIGVASALEPRARWRPTAQGYEMEIDVTPCPLAIDVIVNEMPLGRERRRGQLVMSGAEGELVYLRGDRHEAERLMPLRTDDE